MKEMRQRFIDTRPVTVYSDYVITRVKYRYFRIDAIEKIARIRPPVRPFNLANCAINSMSI